MLATVTIEVGFETKEEKLGKPGDSRSKLYDNRLNPGSASGFQTIHALIDIRRATNMLEVVKRCRPTVPGVDISTMLSDVHFKMLERDSKTMVVTPLKDAKERYSLKCKKHTDARTGVAHTLVVTLHAISVPRLEDRDGFWPR